MTIAFKTFGCRLNRAESLDLESRLAAEGHIIAELGGDMPPDVILVRGCSVTARAQRDCEKEIEHLRRKFPYSKVIIGGCLPGAVDLSSAISFQSAGTVPVLSAGTVPVKSAGTVPVKSAGTVPVLSAGTVPVESAGTVPMRTSRAYLKVQDGCNGNCAFCIVPTFRGKSGSVPVALVLERARKFIRAGYRELVVTGCNLAQYHSEGYDLPDLLGALASLKSAGTVPVHRVRLGSLEPGMCDDKILKTFAKHQNICRFIHLSLQSASDDVLRRMNRPYPISTVERFRERAYELLGGAVSLGADVITGFPGETEEDFLKTCSFVESGPLPFTNLHVFPYSERPGTPAATMDGSLPRSVRIERARHLEKRGQSLRNSFAREFLGRTVEVCVEKGGDHGRTSEYLLCKLSSPAERRSIVSVKVTAVDGDNLIA